MAKQKAKKEDILDALRNAHGLKTGAAELLGLGSWNTIDKYCAKYKEAQEIVDHWKKRRKDRAEYKLDEAIERGESWAIMFTLKNAQDREYSDRVDITTGGDKIKGYAIFSPDDWDKDATDSTIQTSTMADSSPEE